MATEHSICHCVVQGRLLRLGWHYFAQGWYNTSTLVSQMAHDVENYLAQWDTILSREHYFALEDSILLGLHMGTLFCSGVNYFEQGVTVLLRETLISAGRHYFAPEDTILLRGTHTI